MGDLKTSLPERTLNEKPGDYMLLSTGWLIWLAIITLISITSRVLTSLFDCYENLDALVKVKRPSSAQIGVSSGNTD